jgi:hypothetical protein
MGRLCTECEVQARRRMSMAMKKSDLYEVQR